MRRTALSLLALCSLWCGCGSGEHGESSSAGTGPGVTATTVVTGSSGATPTTEGTGGPGSTSPGESDSGEATSTPGTTGTTGTTSTTNDASSGGALDCNADCKSCWDCAKVGACKDVYDACANATFCIPSLTCIGSMCTPDGIEPACTATCCMGCVNLMTCNEVNAAVSCIEAQCAGLCGAATCP